ncbi:MAG: hypothetical protein E7K04_05470 [Helicobacter sp.]|nr:hypothetical protein [Helicobacter sp.]
MDKAKFARYMFVIIIIAIFLMLFLVSVFITTSSGVAQNTARIKALEEKIMSIEKDLKK